MRKAHNKLNLTAHRYGLLEVISQARAIKPRRTRWYCLCDCGKAKAIETSSLRSGSTKSCGCLQKAAASKSGKANATHHGTGTDIYKKWVNMKRRCYDPNTNGYNNYGGRGIVVCDEWLDFTVFRWWAFTNGYKAELTIDRIDPNGNYEPSNCGWATNLEQSRNRRVSRLDILDVTTIRLAINEGAKAADIAREFEVSPSTITDIKTGKIWGRIE